MRALVVAVMTLLQGGGGLAGHWPNTPACRAAAAQALVDFESRLGGGGSATEVLHGWCAEHALADPPLIRAERVPSLDKPADAAVRALLGAAPREAIRYRRVRLTCGAHVLSEADNWYRPGQLTADMNRQLNHTDTPFGAVVGPLNFHRRTLGVEPMFRPEASASLALPHTLLRYRAVLLDPQGAPFSLVSESYTAELLDFDSGCGRVSPGTPARASGGSP